MRTRNSGKREEKQRKGRELEKDGGSEKRVSLLASSKQQRERREPTEDYSLSLSLSPVTGNSWLPVRERETSSFLFPSLAYTEVRLDFLSLPLPMFGYVLLLVPFSLKDHQTPLSVSSRFDGPTSREREKMIWVRLFSILFSPLLSLLVNHHAFFSLLYSFLILTLLSPDI